MMKIDLKGALVGTLLVLSFPSSRHFGAAQTEDAANFAFAESLFSQADYYRAITEYRRFLFFHPTSRFTMEAKFKIAKSYQLGDKLDLAQDLFSELSKEAEGTPLSLLARFEEVDTMYRGGDYEISTHSYLAILKDQKFAAYRGMALYRVGLAALHMGDTSAAKESFSLVRSPASLSGLANDMAGKSDEFSSMKRKSPLLAGLLSTVLPGSGQFYNGRIKDGIIALLTNGLFIWGIYEAFSREAYTLGALASVFELGWYAGNIYGAVNGAHRYNYDKESAFFESIRGRYDMISPVSE